MQSTSGTGTGSDGTNTAQTAQTDGFTASDLSAADRAVAVRGVAPSIFGLTNVSMLSVTLRSSLAQLPAQFTEWTLCDRAANVITSACQPFSLLSEIGISTGSGSGGGSGVAAVDEITASLKQLNFQSIKSMSFVGVMNCDA